MTRPEIEPKSLGSLAITLLDGFPRLTVTAIMTLYKNTKGMVRALDGDTTFFEIVVGVLQGDSLTSYLFILCLDYVLQTSIALIKENGFTLLGMGQGLEGVPRPIPNKKNRFW